MIPSSVDWLVASLGKRLDCWQYQCFCSGFDKSFHLCKSTSTSAGYLSETAGAGGGGGFWRMMLSCSHLFPLRPEPHRGQRSATCRPHPSYLSTSPHFLLLLIRLSIATQVRSCACEVLCNTILSPLWSRLNHARSKRLPCPGSLPASHEQGLNLALVLQGRDRYIHSVFDGWQT